MNDNKNYIQDIILKLNKCKSKNDLNMIRSQYLGVNGIITQKFKKLKTLDVESKKKFSIKINKIKKKILKLLFLKKNTLKETMIKNLYKNNNIDISLSSKEVNLGSVHIITYSINRIINFFSKLGFEALYGPEIESDYYNFDALNIKKNHPSRDNHDTFWFNKNILLRTQTSSMQIRTMEKKTPPVRIIVPGKVYRNDSSLTHSPMFHQIEGFIIDKKINFSNLKWIMKNFLLFFFKKKCKIRFRNSYFPFTTPSAEIDIFNEISKKWLEVLGCGMIHPLVLKKVNINPEKYIGCAFGIGIERLIMLKYNILNIRSFFKNDLRLLKQFK
ncbi:phenylalanine--tRNA ligase subunit alpha [Buchnera aphidicola]|uniref:phenylalanine--tRNA ligase subunit alpha n=1 Tax=Buchnera aphidicola TaxID=9 RepID=UPI0022386232|nr:phenylalanine--tRNA ligase subunit alpha [Buchnera aphidicola]MCW5197631.1 phenylalanine--tRNA ligase subunit alpha [Buchnera aphidicola (Chaitophorus viminalis)]